MSQIMTDPAASPRLKLNKQDMAKLWRSFLLSFLSFVVLWASQALPQVDWGDSIYGMAIASAAPFVLNILRRWVQDNRMTKVKP